MKDATYYREYRERRKAELAKEVSFSHIAPLSKPFLCEDSPEVIALNKPKEPRAYSKPLPAIVWQSKYGCTGCNLKPAAYVDSNEYQGVVHNVYLCKSHLDIHIEYLEHGATKLLERQAAARAATAGRS